MKMDSKYYPILIFGALALGVVLGGELNYTNQPHFLARNNAKNKLDKLIDFIDNEYVDEVNSDSIVNLTLDKILAQLDPHSVYVPSSEQAEIAESMKGDFVGIGVNFYMYKDTVTVVKPLENGPATKAGIRPRFGYSIVTFSNFKTGAGLALSEYGSSRFFEDPSFGTAPSSCWV